MMLPSFLRWANKFHQLLNATAKLLEMAKYISVPCPVCNEYNHPSDGGYNHYASGEETRGWWLQFNCKEHGKYQISSCLTS